MPGMFRNVVGGVAGYESMIQTMPPLCREESVIWDRRWMYQRRSPDTFPQWDQTFVATGCWWPMLRSGGWGGDPTVPTFFSDDTCGFILGAFAAWEYGLGGSQSCKFIMGQTKDVNGNPFPATVTGYRTSDGLIIGSIGTDDKGRYELACPKTPSDAHFLVAEAAGSPPYKGVTVGTLVPTWRDGT